MLLKHLKHENIITLADVFFEPTATLENFDSVYLIFPRIDCDLHYLNQTTTIPPTTIQVFTLQILKALKYIHSAKVLHRDLKPQNILVTLKTLQIVVCDFGTGRAETNLAMTRLKEVTTFNYRSPEAMLLKNIYSCYDSSVDLWSLGCILCELLLNSKQPFFPGESQGSLLENIINTIGSPSNTLVDQYKNLGHNVSTSLLSVLTSVTNVNQTLDVKLRSLPQDAFELVKDLLQFDPRSRKTASEALCHPYLSDYYDEGDRKVDFCLREFSQPFEATSTESELRAQLWDIGNNYAFAENAGSPTKRRNIMI
jgi:p38 MAP kinase